MALTPEELEARITELAQAQQKLDARVRDLEERGLIVGEDDDFYGDEDEEYWDEEDWDEEDDDEFGPSPPPLQTLDDHLRNPCDG
jgi:hypothetical protein